MNVFALMSVHAIGVTKPVHVWVANVPNAAMQLLWLWTMACVRLFAADSDFVRQHPKSRH